MKEEKERFWGWWLIFPIAVLCYLVVLVAKASMTSIFDDDEYRL